MNQYVVLLGIPDEKTPDDIRWETFSSGIMALSPPKAIAKVESEILEYINQLGLDRDQVLVSAVLEHISPEMFETRTPTFQKVKEKPEREFCIQIGIINPTKDEIEWKNVINQVFATSPSEAIEKKAEEIKNYLETHQLTEKDVLISAIVRSLNL
ncbi:MAG: hypothetical protein ACFFDT_01815 [Candidatus Hodarchaeota archaeon]